MDAQDTEAAAEMDALFKSKAQSGDAGVADGRLQFVKGDITNPLVCGIPCSAIVNRCNWRFVNGGADPVRAPWTV